MSVRDSVAASENQLQISRMSCELIFHVLEHSYAVFPWSRSDVIILIKRQRNGVQMDLRMHQPVRRVAN